VRDELLPALLADYDRPGGYGRWAAEERATGAFLGWFALSGRRGGDHASTPPDEGELGYRLKRAVWGRGFATEGARALVRAAFTDLATRRVWAQTMAVNTARSSTRSSATSGSPGRSGKTALIIRKWRLRYVLVNPTRGT
jgi:RimJ/RimL family protein N-acetyltransferase